jgi:hypothetical protein
MIATSADIKPSASVMVMGTAESGVLLKQINDSRDACRKEYRKCHTLRFVSNQVSLKLIA